MNKIEGPVNRFKDFELITDIRDKKVYVYRNNVLFSVHDTHNEAKERIVFEYTGTTIEKLKHPGVNITLHDFRDKLYIVSTKEEFQNQFGTFKLTDLDMNILHYVNKKYKCLHNEKGPASIIIEDNVREYYFNGEFVSFDQWEKLVYNKNFTNALDEIINE